MSYPGSDKFIRYCPECEFSWRGAVPCWFCGGEGTMKDALKEHYVSAVNGFVWSASDPF